LPHAAIHRLRHSSSVDGSAVVAAVNAAMIAALKVPDDSHPVRLSEYEPGLFLIPKDAGEAFTLVEITIFLGRSLETKRRLYEATIAGLGALGMEAGDIRIVLYEAPLDNWGLRGGVPASQIELGFEVEI